MKKSVLEPEAAVAIVRAAAPKDSILLIRRAEHEADPWSGHWSLPGGRRDPGDHGLLQTALRELEEECAIQVLPESLVRALSPMPARRQSGPHLFVAPFVFGIDTQVPATPDPREAVEAHWLPLEIILDPREHFLRSVPRWPGEILFPAINLNRTPLWGFTYRLLTVWLGLTEGNSDSQVSAFQLASSVLDVLVSHGMSLLESWRDPKPNEREVAKMAIVRGIIPEAIIVEACTAPSSSIPLANSIEIRPDLICVTGLEHEEYLIRANYGS